MKKNETRKFVVCTRCGKRRSIDAFTWYESKQRHHSWDVDCVRAYNKERGAARRAAKAAEKAEVAS